MNYFEDVLDSFTNLGPDESLVRKRPATSSVSPERRRQAPRAPQFYRPRYRPTPLLKGILSLPPELISLICDHMISSFSTFILHIHITRDAYHREHNMMFAYPLLSESLEEVLHGVHPIIYTHLSQRAVYRYQVTDHFINLHHSAIHQLIFHLPNYNPVFLAFARPCQEWEVDGRTFSQRPSAFLSVATFIASLGQWRPATASRLARDFETRFDEVQSNGLVRTVRTPWNLALPTDMDLYPMRPWVTSCIRGFDRVVGHTARLGDELEEKLNADAAPYATASLAQERWQERYNEHNKKYFYVMSQGRVLKCEPKGEQRMKEIVDENGELIWRGYQDIIHQEW